ncbi:hypothetical protein ABIC55_004280 [Sporosarcina psychrophila]|uniref:DnaD domain-containing protein n=1 Tax=Sporosarcina psychrophila TaxID=1476 RepID=A0ABV2KDJ9_SPOPS
MNVQEPKELIDYLNATEPIQMLKDISGYPPTKLELMVIQDLECFYEFKKPVVNLILQYILKTNGGMLTINHLMHVAERVAINKIVTAEQAIRFFKSLNQDDIWISVEYEAYKPFMLTYMKEMNVTYKLQALILHEIVRYSRNQNQGYFIHWFTDKLIEYVAKNSVYEVEAVKALLENFHEKYIVPMGK